MQGVVDTAWNHYHRHGRDEGRKPNDVDPDILSRGLSGDRARPRPPAGRRRRRAALHHVGPGARLSAERRRAAGGERRGAAVAVRRVLDRSGQRARSHSGPARPGMDRPARGGDAADDSRWKGSWNSTGRSTARRCGRRTGGGPGVHRDVSGSVVRRAPARGGRGAAMAAGTDRAADGGAGSAHGVPRDPRNAAGQGGHRFSRAVFGAPATTDREPGVPARGGAARPGCRVARLHAAASVRGRDVRAGGQPSDGAGGRPGPAATVCPICPGLANTSRCRKLAAPATGTSARPWRAARSAVRALLHGQEPRRIDASAGKRMIRHANLIHAVAAPEPPLQRRSLTAWYCPSYVAPCYVETTPVRMHALDGLRVLLRRLSGRWIRATE